MHWVHKHVEQICTNGNIVAYEGHVGVARSMQDQKALSLLLHPYVCCARMTLVLRRRIALSSVIVVLPRNWWRLYKCRWKLWYTSCDQMDTTHYFYLIHWTFLTCVDGDSNWLMSKFGWVLQCHPRWNWYVNKTLCPFTGRNLVWRWSSEVI